MIVYCAAMSTANFDDVIFSATLVPHRSLGRRGFLLLMGGIAGALVHARPLSSGGSAPGRSSASAGSTSWRSTSRSKLNYRAARHYEEVEVSRAEIVVRKVTASGRAQEFRFNPQWVRLEVERSRTKASCASRCARATAACRRRVPEPRGPQELRPRLRRGARDGARLRHVSGAQELGGGGAWPRAYLGRERNKAMAFEAQMSPKRGRLRRAPRAVERLRRRPAGDRVRHRATGATSRRSKRSPRMSAWSRRGCKSSSPAGPGFRPRPSCRR